MKRLWQSGQMVGQDVIGSMTNILLFVYVSGTIPMLLVYFNNGWPLRDAVELHLSLELLRVISGSLGIVLSIPITLLLLFRPFEVSEGDLMNVLLLLALLLVLLILLVGGKNGLYTILGLFINVLLFSFY